MTTRAEGFDAASINQNDDQKGWGAQRGLKINRSLLRDSARMMDHKSFLEFSRTAR